MKNIHLALAILTLGGFVLRGAWMLCASPLLRHPLARIIPHIVDTLFLVTGIALVLQLRLPVLQSHWLLAKFAGLAAYIVLGAIALRYGRSMRIRIAAFVAALLAFAYIVGAAITRSPLSWTQYL